MNHETFAKIVEHRLRICRDILISKNKEYSSDTDRLHNFKTAGRINNESPAKALWGMYTKHLVSVQDMVNDPSKISAEAIKEKITDSINYHLLLEGIFSEVLEDVGAEETFYSAQAVTEVGKKLIKTLSTIEPMHIQV